MRGRWYLSSSVDDLFTIDFVVLAVAAEVAGHHTPCASAEQTLHVSHTFSTCGFSCDWGTRPCLHMTFVRWKREHPSDSFGEQRRVGLVTLDVADSHDRAGTSIRASDRTSAQCSNVDWVPAAVTVRVASGASCQQ